MLGAVVFLALGVLAAEAGSVEHKMIMKKVDTYNVLANCWGQNNMLKYVVAQKKAMEFCSQLDAPLFPANGLKAGGNDQLDALRVLLANPSLANLLLQGQQNNNGLYSRSKRGSGGLLDVTEEDYEEFLGDYEDWKSSIETKMGNLSCVMTQLKMLDASGEININYYKDGIWNDIEKTAAAKDPAFIERMRNGYDDCYKISESWPQQSLNRHPFSKKFGRHWIFFECAKKVEHKNCYMYEIKQWIEALYGPIQDKEGFPEDKYDHAALGLMVMYNSATPEEKFVDNALWGPSKFM